MIRTEVKFEEHGKKPFKGKLSNIISFDLAKVMNESVMTELITGANDLRNNMIISMQKSPKTGRRYKRGRRWHTASSPMNPPRPDYGGLIGSFEMEASEKGVEVGSIIEDPPYPFYLEKGTKKMDPRPFMEPALEDISPKLETDIAKAIIDSVGG